MKTARFIARASRGAPISVARPFQNRQPFLSGTGNLSTSRQSPVEAYVFPTDGFERLPSDRKFEEETLPNYSPARYYPVRLGEVFQSRYQIVAKLGYGQTSTIWLCRDLQQNCLLMLKVGIAQQVDHQVDNEMAISKHLVSRQGYHPGRELLRLAIADFQVVGTFGTHECLLFNPLGTTIAKFQESLPDGVLNMSLLLQTLQYLLISLDFLHQSNVVHTDISPSNILLGVNDFSRFGRVEQAERDHPSPRKVLADRSIYASRQMSLKPGAPVLSDFGAAKIGQFGYRAVMPDVNRAPEVILGIKWDSKIDIWAVGVTIWNFLEGRNLFNAQKNGIHNNEQHLAEMVSLMGPPPREILERSKRCAQYWDSEGNWIADTPIPNQSFESREEHLHGEDRQKLLVLVRKILRWLPEERPTARELLQDEFLAKPDDYLVQDTPI